MSSQLSSHSAAALAVFFLALAPTATAQDPRPLTIQDVARVKATTSVVSSPGPYLYYREGNRAASMSMISRAPSWLVSSDESYGGATSTRSNPIRLLFLIRAARQSRVSW